VHVLIPIKRLETCKQRLSGVLDAARRRALMLALLDDVLERAFAAPSAAAVGVVTDDPAAAEAAREAGADVLSDGGLAWNEGLVHALALLREPPAGVLFLSADLPTVSTADVEAMIAACPPRGIAIGRAHDAGTNALALRPSNVIVPSFGAPGSSAVHAALAADAGVPAVLVDRPGLALDLDTPSDLTEALAAPVGGARSWRTVVHHPAAEASRC
jgi:2-phospho-L-lactate guanylyltransferase